MRKISILLLVFVILSFTFKPVNAVTPSSFSSTVNITNTTNSAGTVTLTYYNPDGSVAATADDDIDPYETKWYVTLPGLTTSFSGSMVISSSVQLGSTSTVIAKNSTGTPFAYASYTGFSTGNTKVYLPLLMDSNYGFNTFYSIQNVSTSPVDVTITYSDGLAIPMVEDLQPNAAIKIDNKTEAHVAKKFSAILDASGPIAVTVVEWTDVTKYDPLLSFNGFTDGVTNPIFSMVNQNNYGYWTAIPIQNLGTTDTNVTVTYTPTKAGTACTETITIPAEGQVEFGSYAFVFKYNAATPPYAGMSSTCLRGKTFVGNAVVTGNSADQPLVGIINQTTTIKPGTDKGGTLMGLDKATATSTVVFPDVYQWYGTEKWWSSITISNLSGTTLPIGDITCHAVGTGPGGLVDLTYSNTTELADTAGWIQDLYDSYGPMPNGFVGGVICTSATGQIAGSSNTLGAGLSAALDSYALYEGINQ